MWTIEHTKEYSKPNQLTIICMWNKGLPDEFRFSEVVDETTTLTDILRIKEAAEAARQEEQANRTILTRIVSAVRTVFGAA